MNSRHFRGDNLSTILKSAWSHWGNFNKYNLTYLVIFTKRIRKALLLTKLLNDLALYKLKNDWLKIAARTAKAMSILSSFIIVGFITK